MPIELISTHKVLMTYDGLSGKVRIREKVAETGQPTDYRYADVPVADFMRATRPLITAAIRMMEPEIKVDTSRSPMLNDGDYAWTVTEGRRAFCKICNCVQPTYGQAVFGGDIQVRCCQASHIIETIRFG
jgi:hypothetical protein